LAAALPLGLATAIWLSESTLQRPRLQRAVRLSLDMLAGVPSIVFGLFGNAVFAVALGMGLSILSGGLTLACMALPIIIRTAEEGLRALPAELRLQAAALGLRRSRIVLGLLLPAALPALLAGTLLGIGRALAETAALIFTSGYVDRAPQSWLDSGRALSVHIYDLSMNVPGGERNAYTSALVLMALILGINAATHAAARQWRHALRWQDPATIDR
jgi:phosphate transport system permease protein